MSNALVGNRATVVVSDSSDSSSGVAPSREQTAGSSTRGARKAGAIRSFLLKYNLYMTVCGGTLGAMALLYQLVTKVSVDSSRDIAVACFSAWYAICAIALLKNRKWGYFGIWGVALLHIVLVHEVQAAAPLIVLVILGRLLHMGRPNSAWSHMV